MEETTSSHSVSEELTVHLCFVYLEGRKPVGDVASSVARLSERDCAFPGECDVDNQVTRSDDIDGLHVDLFRALNATLECPLAMASNAQRLVCGFGGRQGATHGLDDIA